MIKNIFISALLPLVLLSACSGGSNNGAQGSVTSVAISPANPSVDEGASGQLTAIATFFDGTTADVTSDATWSSSSSAIVQVSNASGSKGRYLAVAEGSATILAAVSGRVGSTVVTVGQQTPAITVSSISITPQSASVVAGRTIAFAANAMFSDGTSRDVTDEATWSVTPISVAEVTNVAPGKGVAKGKVVGSATVAASLGGKTSNAQLTVTEALLESIAVGPDQGPIKVGATRQLSAIGSYSDGTQKDLTGTASWGSSDAAVLSVGTAGADSGLITAEDVGSATISAVVGNVTGQLSVTVVTNVISAIEVSPSSADIVLGESRQLEATARYADNRTEVVTSDATWDSTNPSVAEVNDSGAKGLVASRAEGTASVRATYEGQTGSSSISVIAKELRTIVIEPAQVSLGIATEAQLTLRGTYSDGTTGDLTEAATWTSSIPANATVSDSAGSKGLVSGLKKGSTVISAAISGVTSATRNVSVTDAVLQAIQIAPLNLEMPAVPPTASPKPAPYRQQYSATGVYSDGSTRDITRSVTWSSTVTGVASIVSGSGLAESKANGITTITATVGSLQASTRLTVNQSDLEGVVITPKISDLPIGESQQFVAMGKFTDSADFDLTTYSGLQWKSDDTGELTITSTGLAKAIAKDAAAEIGTATEGVRVQALVGTSCVVGSPGGNCDVLQLAVTDPVVTALRLSPESLTLANGFTEDFQVFADFSDGTRNKNVTGSDLVFWSTRDPQVAFVNDPQTGDLSAVVTGLTAGATVLDVTYSTDPNSTADNVSVSAAITVTAAFLQSIEVKSAVSGANTVALGTETPLSAIGTFSNGEVSDLTTEVTWRTTNSKAAVSNDAGREGVVTGLEAGTTTVTAVSGTISGSLPMTVTNSQLVSLALGSDFPGLSDAIYNNTNPSFQTDGADRAFVVVDQPYIDIPEGANVQLRAIGTFSDSSLQDLTSTADWSAPFQEGDGEFAISNVVGQKGLVTVTGDSGVTNGDDNTPAPESNEARLRAEVLVNGVARQVTMPALISNSIVGRFTMTPSNRVVPEGGFVVDFVTSREMTDGSSPRFANANFVCDVVAGVEQVQTAPQGGNCRVTTKDAPLTSTLAEVKATANQAAFSGQLAGRELSDTSSIQVTAEKLLRLKIGSITSGLCVPFAAGDDRLTISVGEAITFCALADFDGQTQNFDMTLSIEVDATANQTAGWFATGSNQLGQGVVQFDGQNRRTGAACAYAAGQSAISLESFDAYPANGVVADPVTITVEQGLFVVDDCRSSPFGN